MRSFVPSRWWKASVVKCLGDVVCLVLERGDEIVVHRNDLRSVDAVPMHSFVEASSLPIVAFPEGPQVSPLVPAGSVAFDPPPIVSLGGASELRTLVAEEVRNVVSMFASQVGRHAEVGSEVGMQIVVSQVGRAPGVRRQARPAQQQPVQQTQHDCQVFSFRFIPEVDPRFLRAAAESSCPVAGHFFDSRQQSLLWEKGCPGWLRFWEDVPA